MCRLMVEAAFIVSAEHAYFSDTIYESNINDDSHDNDGARSL